MVFLYICAPGQVFFIFPLFGMIFYLHFNQIARVSQGFGSFLLRDLPFDAFQFCIYEQLKIGYGKRVCTSNFLSIQQ
jgi:hypothetical protein